jgi:hypothetical protein
MRKSPQQQQSISKEKISFVTPTGTRDCILWMQASEWHSRVRVLTQFGTRATRHRRHPSWWLSPEVDCSSSYIQLLVAMVIWCRIVAVAPITTSPTSAGNLRWPCQIMPFTE